MINTPQNPIKICHKCKVVLNENNMWTSYMKNHIWVCKDCTRKYAKEYSRKHLIEAGDGKYLKGIKRDYPTDEKCEICNIFTPPPLNYHHWDDTNLMKGIWICGRCHLIAEGVEKINSVEAKIYLRWKGILS